MPSAGSYAALRANLIQDAAIQALWQNQIQSRVRITDDQIDAFLSSPESARLNQVQYRLYIFVCLILIILPASKTASRPP